MTVLSAQTTDRRVNAVRVDYEPLPTVFDVIVERAVMNEMPDVRLLWARTMAEAVAVAVSLRMAAGGTVSVTPIGTGVFSARAHREIPRRGDSRQCGLPPGSQ